MRIIFIILFSFAGTLLQADVSVDVSVDQNTGLENTPFHGTITITHPQDASIVTSSFLLGGNPITPNPVQNTVLNPKTVISIYSFILPAKAAGLYVLPVLTAKVGNKTYQSIPASYEIRGAGAGSRTAARPAPIQERWRPSPSSTPTLKLESKIQGPTELYPGQRTILFYRISYNRSIDLTQTTLPFSDPNYFQKIGDAHITDYQDTLYTVQEIKQEIEALKPGQYIFGPGSIAGYYYEIDPSGQRAYHPDPLHAEVSPLPLAVHPFPLKDKPFTFNGSLGSIQVDLKMTSPATINVGEEVKLQLSLSGVSNISQLKLPDLACQPGFSGFFLLNDLPPSAEEKEGVKIFQIQMTPITALASSVPAIEISSFDPGTGKYSVHHTDPLPLTIKPFENPIQKGELKPLLAELQPDWNKIWEAPFRPAPSLELPNPVIPTTYPSYQMTTSPHVFWIIPGGILLFIIMHYVHLYWITHPRKEIPRSQLLLDQALNNKTLTPAEVIRLLEQSAWWKLQEKGLLTPSVEDLPFGGWVGDIRQFILHLQALQYGQNKDFILKEIQANAKIILNGST